jgi:hypothetical protein
LVTATNLEDSLTTCGARVSIFANQGGALNRVSVTLVSVVLIVSNDFETVLARMELADLALVLSREIATTICLRASHDELAAFTILSVLNLSHTNIMYIHLFLNVALMLLEFKDLFAEFSNTFLFIAPLSHTLCGFHCLWYLAQLAVKKQLFAVDAKLFAHPGVVKIVDQEALTPCVFTAHAMGVLGSSQKVLACACLACGPVTVTLLTIYWSAVRTVKCVTADWARFSHSYL